MTYVRVLVCGKSGSGKSTICNKLIKSNNAFEIGHGLEQTTITCKTNDGNGYEVTELVGTGGSDSGTIPHKNAVRLNKKFLSKNRKYDCILYVAQGGRFDQADYDSWAKQSSMLSKHGKNVVIVFTKNWGWLERNKSKIADVYERMGNVEMTEVDFGHSINRDAKSMDNLNAAIKKAHTATRAPKKQRCFACWPNNILL